MSSSTNQAPSQQRLWSAFVLVVGVLLAGLCALSPSTIALCVACVLMLAGLLGLLLGRS
jgi:hypothetical protein